MQRIFFLFIFLLTSARGQKEGAPCVDEYSNTVGKCTVLSQCESATKNVHQSRIVPTFCSSGDKIVCCRDESSILNAPAAPVIDDPPIWGSSSDSNDRRRISERKCDEYSRIVVREVGYIPLIPDPEAFTESEANCEYTGVELIVGGQNIKPGEFPHMAAIGWAGLNGGYQFRCGGTLISPRFVVTAAHCNRDVNAQKPEPVIVRLGDQNIDSNVYDGANPVDIAIRRIHVHPDYSAPKLYNDIALLELAFDVTLGSVIRPACLWTKEDLGDHQKVIATGWGFNDPNTTQTAKELKKVSLSILDDDFCNRTLKALHTRNWAKGFIDSQMCVGDLRGGNDICKVDSGGPVQVVANENFCIFHIVGVKSFGKKCSGIDSPFVYTRISSYIDWIESIVWPGQ